MTRFTTTILLAAALTVAVLVRPSPAQVDIQIGIGIPPPPVVVFERPPRVIVVPRSQVYYAPSVSDYDMYRLGRHWYIHQNGYWYRSRSYRGPFRALDDRYLPRAIRGVPAKYRRFAPRPPRQQHAPGPGQRRDRGRDRDRGR